MNHYTKNGQKLTLYGDFFYLRLCYYVTIIYILTYTVPKGHVFHLWNSIFIVNFLHTILF